MKNTKTKKKKDLTGIFPWLLTLAIIIIVGVSLAYYSDISAPEEEPIVDEQVIGGQTDEYGCLSPAGYTWCEENQECLRLWEQPCQDEVNKILADLRDLVEVDWTEVEEDEIEWQKIIGYDILSGQKIAAYEISDQQFRAVENFFTDNGFDIDVYNVAAGTISGATGYQKYFVACKVIGGVTGYQDAEVGEEWEPANPHKKDIEISCGLLSDIN